MEWRIGCSSWTSEAWWGRVYPRGLADGERLAWYARLWPVVEVDSTYYRAPADRVVTAWARRSPEAFRFALKVPREFLDPKRPVEEEKVAAFARTVDRLGAKLGPLLAQFPPWFRVSPHNAERLDRIIELLAGPRRLAVELREAGWFRPPEFPALLGRLRDRSVALTWSCLTYVEVPDELTSDWAYLRFIADHTTVPAEQHGRLVVDRAAETRRWAHRVQARADALKEAWVFFNNHFAGFAPESLNRFRAAVGLPAVPYALDERPGALEAFGTPADRPAP